MKTAVWSVKGQPELMKVRVLRGFPAFERLINSHRDMQFVRWEKRESDYSLNVLWNRYQRDKAEGSEERFGQWFANRYVAEPWPELYHAHLNHSLLMVITWLKRNQYTTELPQETEAWKRSEDTNKQT